MEKQQANAVTLTMTPEAISAMLAAMYVKDADFRAAFDQDPKAAISKACGHEMAADAKIVVHRNEDKCWHVALPSQEMIALLSDKEISGVSGGTGGGSFGATLAHGIVGFLDLTTTGARGTTLSEEDAAAVAGALDVLTTTFGRIFGHIATSAAAAAGGAGSGSSGP